MKNMYFILLFALHFFAVVNCQEKSKVERPRSNFESSDDNQCLKTEDIETILASIFTSEDFKEYSNPIIENKEKIRIAENQYFTKGLSMKNGNHNIIIVDSTALDERIFILNFQKVDCEKKKNCVFRLVRIRTR